MSTWLVVFLFSLLFVAVFMAGMSITLMVKGRHIDSEIGTNRHMRERGITCVVEDARREQNGNCPSGDDVICSSGQCSSCDVTHR